jgi:hypothetical protein
MNKPNTPPDKVFRVDKRLVIFGLLPFQVFMILALLIFLNGITQIPKTLTSLEFWWWFIGIVGVGALLDLWTILYERTEFRGPVLTNYFNSSKSVDINDIAFIRQKKTIYGNYLGLEYKEPKGIFVRFLFPYKAYSPNTLKEIIGGILTINPNIKLEDDLSKQITEGTYKSKVLGE